MHVPQSSTTWQPLHSPHLVMRSLALDMGFVLRGGGGGGCLTGRCFTTVMVSGSEAEESSTKITHRFQYKDINNRQPSP